MPSCPSLFLREGGCAPFCSVMAEESPRRGVAELIRDAIVALVSSQLLSVFAAISEYEDVAEEVVPLQEELGVDGETPEEVLALEVKPS